MSTYHYRDKITGQFYKGINRFYQQTEKTAIVSTIEYLPKGKGKKFTDIGKAKLHLLFLIGFYEPPETYRKLDQKHKDIIMRYRTWRASYNHTTKEWSEPPFKTDQEYIANERAMRIYEAMHPGYFSLPEWLSNSYPVEIPETWELVEYDSDRNTVTVVDFDPMAYIAHQTKLRNLVYKFGVSVKDVFKKIEKKGTLAEFPTMIVISPNFERMSDDELWESIEKPTPNTADIDDVLKTMGIKRGDFVRSTSHSTTAIAFRDIGHLMHFRLAYGGKHQVYTINISTLEEVFDAVNAAA